MPSNSSSFSARSRLRPSSEMTSCSPRSSFFRTHSRAIFSKRAACAAAMAARYGRARCSLPTAQRYTKISLAATGKLLRGCHLQQGCVCAKCRGEQGSASVDPHGKWIASCQHTLALRPLDKGGPCAMTGLRRLRGGQPAHDPPQSAARGAVCARGSPRRLAPACMPTRTHAHNALAARTSAAGRAGDVRSSAPRSPPRAGNGTRGCTRGNSPPPYPAPTTPTPRPPIALPGAHLAA